MAAQYPIYYYDSDYEECGRNNSRTPQAEMAYVKTVEQLQFMGKE